MSSVCDHCGYKCNEVKSSTGISENGKRIELHLTDHTDLSRDILKVNWLSIIIFHLALCSHRQLLF